MKHPIIKSVGVAAAVALALSACSSGGSTTTTSSSAAGMTSAAMEPVTLSLAGWSLDTTPEFQLLADSFHAAHPNVTVDLKEYDATEYDTQMTADLAAGSAPDLYIQKNLKNFFTYEDGGQLMDVSDVASQLNASTSGLSAYQVDGKTYAVPYRQDSWYLYYNKDMFDKAGVSIPDGSWTWDDYAAAAKKLTAGLGGGDVTGAYEHGWQSTLQGFANAQAPGADILTGKFDHFKSYYNRVVAMQDEGSQPTFGTVTTNKLTYQGEFGKQKAAMMLMGSWYVATLITQAGTGDADTFNWGIAPAPQFDSSTTKMPVTFGDPTGIGINPAIDKSKVDAAKEFLAFIGGEDAAKALAGIGITPAFASSGVTDAYFALAGVPTDDLSKFTFGTHDTKPENPVSTYTSGIQNILSDMHTAIMSESSSVDAAIADAQTRTANEVLNQ